MVAPNPLWLPPILYGCPQSFMVALVDYFLRVALAAHHPLPQKIRKDDRAE